MSPFRRNRVLNPLDANIENVRLRDLRPGSKEDQWKWGPYRPTPRGAKLQALRKTGSPVVLIYDPDARLHPTAMITHIQDEERVLQRMLEEFDTFGRVIVGWPYHTVTLPGSFCMLMQDGHHPHGCFAQGEIVGGPLIDVDGHPIVIAMFRKMTDPRRAKFLTAEDGLL